MKQLLIKFLLLQFKLSFMQSIQNDNIRMGDSFDAIWVNVLLELDYLMIKLWTYQNMLSEMGMPTCRQNALVE